MKARNYSSIFTLIAIELFVFLFVSFMYTFLHESGHALTGWIFGQSLTDFSVSFWNFRAHVDMVGGTLSETQLAIRAMAGASLPLLTWALFISLMPRRASFILESLKLLSSMMVVNTLLVWIILPILFLLQKVPSDDVTNFLRDSQMPPLLLAGVALILYAGGWVLFLSRIEGLRNEFLLFRVTNMESLAGGARMSIPVLGAIMGFCLVLVFTVNSLAGGNPSDRFSPPPDFDTVAQIDLSTQAYRSVTLAKFTVEEPEYVGVFIDLRNINTAYFDLSISGPDEFRSTVLHGEGYNTFRDGGLWEERLPAGTYQIVLTSHQSPGSLYVYMKTPNSK